jgi:hypothetical protein
MQFAAQLRRRVTVAQSYHRLPQFLRDLFPQTRARSAPVFKQRTGPAQIIGQSSRHTFNLLAAAHKNTPFPRKETYRLPFCRCGCNGNTRRRRLIYRFGCENWLGCLVGVERDHHPSQYTSGRITMYSNGSLFWTEVAYSHHGDIVALRRTGCEFNHIRDNSSR